MTATIPARAESPRPPALFAEETGPPGGLLPERALAGKSRTVEINHQNLHSGRLWLSLPGGLRVGAIRDHQENLGGGRFAWVGHAIGNRAERIILGVSDKAVAGTFVRKGKLFKLEPRADGSQILSEVDSGEPAPESDPIPVTVPVTTADPVSSGTLTLGAETVADASQQIIDVLVAYTPKVEQLYGADGADALIILAVAETNRAYENSGINPRLHLVHSLRTSYVESGSKGTDLDRLQNTSDGNMDELHALRDSHGADLVSLLVDSRESCGKAYQMNNLSAGFAPYAFSVVHHSCATGSYSFAHELGHNQGAHHDPANGSGAIYPYAYGYQEPLGRFRTIMAYDCSGGCPRIDHFSSPDILYNNNPTGDANSDNARTLDNTAATVANFRAQVQLQPPRAPYGLQATAAGDLEIRLSWVDASSDETGFFLERAGTKQNFALIASLPANTVNYRDTNLQADTLYYYRTRAFNSAGKSSYSNTAITATDPTPATIPSAPSGLDATGTGVDSISLSWHDTSNNESGFTLQRSPNGSGGWTTIADLAADTLHYHDAGLEAGTIYYYRLRAYNATGASAFSSDSTRTYDIAASKLLRQRDLF